jgi:hypothetical protein
MYMLPEGEDYWSTHALGLPRYLDGQLGGSRFMHFFLISRRYVTTFVQVER